MLLGLPLLLFAVRLRDSWRNGRSMLLGFLLCCVSGLVATLALGYWMGSDLPEGWKVAGMLTGLYTGGTPNVQAIGLALAAPANYLVLVQAADVLLGGAYLLGLLSFLPRIYALFFPAFHVTKGAADPETAQPINRVAGGGLRNTGLLFLLGLSVTGLSLLLTYAFTDALENSTLVILLVTTLSLLVGTQSKLRQLGNSYPLGEYFILVFCVALGLLADFRQLAAEGGELLYFSALALSITTVLHLLLCYLFRLDRDSVILSSVAGLYGPVFVVQVAASIKNKSLLAAGIAVSLLGFALGNYLGIGVGYAVKWLLGV